MPLSARGVIFVMMSSLFWWRHQKYFSYKTFLWWHGNVHSWLPGKFHQHGTSRSIKISSVVYPPPPYLRNNTQAKKSLGPVEKPGRFLALLGCFYITNYVIKFIIHGLYLVFLHIWTHWKRDLYQIDQASYKIHDGDGKTWNTDVLFDLGDASNWRSLVTKGKQHFQWYRTDCHTCHNPFPGISLWSQNISSQHLVYAKWCIYSLLTCRRLDQIDQYKTGSLPLRIPW